jgi:hypothetical protein
MTKNDRRKADIVKKLLMEAATLLTAFARSQGLNASTWRLWKPSEYHRGPFKGRVSVLPSQESGVAMPLSRFSPNVGESELDGFDPNTWPFFSSISTENNLVLG